jgi:hypothetical protein
MSTQKLPASGAASALARSGCGAKPVAYLTDNKHNKCFSAEFSAPLFGPGRDARDPLENVVKLERYSGRPACFNSLGA